VGSTPAGCSFYRIARPIGALFRPFRHGPPHEFGKPVHPVVVFYQTALPALIEPYVAQMEAWRAEYPKARFIYVISGFMGPKFEQNNAASQAFGKLVRERFEGKAPVYDRGAILSDDFRAGQVYCPEDSQDPAEVHPNLPAGESMPGKGSSERLTRRFLLARRFPSPSCLAFEEPLASSGAIRAETSGLQSDCNQRKNLVPTAS